MNIRYSLRLGPCHISVLGLGPTYFIHLVFHIKLTWHFKWRVTVLHGQWIILCLAFLLLVLIQQCYLSLNMFPTALLQKAFASSVDRYHQSCLLASPRICILMIYFITRKPCTLTGSLCKWSFHIDGFVSCDLVTKFRSHSVVLLFIVH